jgi:5,8-dihydroxy-2-naphthoate synthase
VTLSVAISPCPNDTFAFHALAHGLVPDVPAVSMSYADIDMLNQRASAGLGDVVKVSYAALPWLLEQYELLPCGGALGRGCGPLVLTADGRPPESLAGATVAIPGRAAEAGLVPPLPRPLR